MKKFKSRELHAGVVYIDCDCYHRNGLQHDCPRTSCTGKRIIEKIVSINQETEKQLFRHISTLNFTGPPCKVKPWPKCDLGMYFMNKWNKYYEFLDTVPPISFCGSKEKWQAILEEERQKLKEKLEEKEGGEKEDADVKTERVREMLADAK